MNLKFYNFFVINLGLGSIEENSISFYILIMDEKVLVLCEK